MKSFWVTVALVYGLMTGSFINMAVYRLKNGITFFKPARSFCDSCGKTLGFGELFPVLGWLIGKGRSRCCGTKLSPVYPLVELGAGLVFAGVAGFLVR